MHVGVPKESVPGEHRVAATPDSVTRLKKLGFDVVVEFGAGLAAGFDDGAYQVVGATVVDVTRVWACPIIAKIRAPTDAESPFLRPGQTVISYVYPAQNDALVERLQNRGISAIAMDQVPRTTRAQKVDALSSMGNLAGYRAVIEAAAALQRPLSGQVTAAGKIPPCKVLVIGAGVAGLAAIGAARSLGAIVRAFDTRPVVREQVASLGAEFLEVKIAEDGSGTGGYAKTMSPEYIAAEMTLFAAQAREVDIIITTALIPGKRAPVLLDPALVASMRRGSVIVDLAAEQGGNCSETVPGRSVDSDGVTIIGFTNLPSRLSLQASTLYATNIVNLLEEMGGAENFTIDESNDIVRPMTVLKDGKLLWPPPKLAEAAKPVAPPPQQAPAATVRAKTGASKSLHGPPVAERASRKTWVFMFGAGLALYGLGVGTTPTFLTHFTVFVLACFIGYHVVWSVTPALHTPLMSVTNAISGIIVLGGMAQIGGGTGSAAAILGLLAVFLATINVSGGFLVTQRMLKMFRK